jgi:hypothetical protein
MHFRTLFLDGSDDSASASELLTHKRISFSKAEVPPNSSEFRDHDLPLLVTDEGQWRGLGRIQRYVNNHIYVNNHKEH